MELIITFVIICWSAFIFLVKTLVYLVYIAPIFVAKILDIIGVWPNIWPFPIFI